jgi:hypothetical protein
MKAHEMASGRNRSIATYLVGKLGPEQLRTSACTWTRDMPSLWPKTDLLYFADPASLDPPITVSWDAAMPVVGALMQRTEDHPPRYLVESFPNAVQLAQLADIAAAARRDARAQAARAAQEAQAALAAQNGQKAPPVKSRATGTVRPSWQAVRTVLARWVDTKPAHAR